MYVELVERDIKNRNTFVEWGQVSQSPADFERYISLFPFDKGVIDYVSTHKSISGYVGLHYCPAVLIDIDSEYISEAQQSAIELITRLNEVYTCAPDNLRIYYSGNKGFHIVMPEQLFGQIPPNKDVAKFVKLFVESISEGIKNVDTKIYEEHRIIRCVNSLNAKSGRYKIPITFDELNGSIEDIKKTAEQPRVGFIHKRLNRDILICEPLRNKLASIRIETDKIKQVDVGFFAPPESGDRNNKLFKQACMLFDRTELTQQSIGEIIRSINSASNDPLPVSEITNIIQSASVKTSRKVKQTDLIVKPFSGWVDQWYESILPERNRLSLLFPSYDIEMAGRLRGCLIVVAGFGGCKKSLFAQNVIYQNAVNYESRAIYSTMEMGASQLMDRFINMACQPEDNMSASIALREAEKTKPGFAREYASQHIAPFFSDKLLITENTGLTSKEYTELIDQTEQRNGKTDILVVDGLSMMGGNGTEKELVDKHTRELKELAVKHNMAVIAIVHVTKDADKFTRDYTKFLRGSGKIYDNLDILINMSLFDDGMGAELRNKGYSKLINKRGSGNHIERVYSFDNKRLLMEETNETPDNATNF